MELPRLLKIKKSDLSDRFSIIFSRIFFTFQGYEGSLLKVTSKNGKTASVSMNMMILLLFLEN